MRYEDNEKCQSTKARKVTNLDNFCESQHGDKISFFTTQA